VAFEHLAEQRYGAEGARRVGCLLEWSMDDERIRFGIEGMGGQLVIALDERLLVVKPGFAEEPNLDKLATIIYYSEVTVVRYRSGLNRLGAHDPFAMPPT